MSKYPQSLSAGAERRVGELTQVSEGSRALACMRHDDREKQAQSTKGMICCIMM